jgi:hypothetical protein
LSWAGKPCHVADNRDERQRRDRADARNRHQVADIAPGERLLGELALNELDFDIQRVVQAQVAARGEVGWRELRDNSARLMLDALISGTHDPNVLADLAKGALRKKIPALREALQGSLHRPSRAADRADARPDRLPRRDDRDALRAHRGAHPPFLA